MTFQGGGGDGKYGDLDRSDFFQIHTYMSYYQNDGYDVVAGGLLYPMEITYDESKCLSESLFGKNNEIKFIVDGLDLSNITDKDSIKKSEDDFMIHIQHLINQT